MLAYTSASTAKRWLKKMGFVYSKFAKEFMLMDMSMKMLLNIERNF